ncbi:MAG: molybdopterin-binding protein, partial [Anaerolineae bacterium]|nr:molybdopterin-binding protein [Anaerolineae bacterium]
MTEFMELIPPGEALAKLLQHLPVAPVRETIESVEGLGRVLAENIEAPHAMPPFVRSTVDGYAVKAADTFGASETLPTYLDMVGEILMGKEPGFGIAAGRCGLIHTGGMLPEGADAVVMVERTQVVNEAQVEIHKAAAVGENVIHAGEDVAEGEVVMEKGKRLRAAEIGGLMAIGRTQVDVAKRPRVGILSTGNEVVPPTIEPRLGQVRDINTYTLSEIVAAAGGEAVPYGILADDQEKVAEISEEALEACDMVMITAGSSVSHRDITAEVIEGLGEPGVLVHGINLRPGKPTIFGVCGGKAVIGLPGNP